jgi:hypothetical protein
MRQSEAPKLLGPFRAAVFPQLSPFGALFGRTQSKRGMGVSGPKKDFDHSASQRAPVIASRGPWARFFFRKISRTINHKKSPEQSYATHSGLTELLPQLVGFFCPGRGVVGGCCPDVGPTWKRCKVGSPALGLSALPQASYLPRSSSFSGTCQSERQSVLALIVQRHQERKD